MGGTSDSPPPSAPPVRPGVSGTGSLPSLCGASESVSRGLSSLACDETVEPSSLLSSVGTGFSGGDTSVNSSGMSGGGAVWSRFSRFTACSNTSRMPGTNNTACSRIDATTPQTNARSRRDENVPAVVAMSGLHPLQPADNKAADEFAQSRHARERFQRRKLRRFELERRDAHVLDPVHDAEKFSHAHMIEIAIVGFHDLAHASIDLVARCLRHAFLQHRANGRLQLAAREQQVTPRRVNVIVQVRSQG